MTALIVEKPKVVIEALVRLGANVSLLDRLQLPPLCYASTEEAVDALLDAGASVRGPFHPLTSAIYRNKEAAVRALLRRGADVHEENLKSGMFPLKVAIHSPLLVDLLLQVLFIFFNFYL